MRRIFQIDERPENIFSAWSKAPCDVSEILAERGVKSVDIAFEGRWFRNRPRIRRMFWQLRLKFGFGMRKDDTLIVQHPLREQFFCHEDRERFWRQLRDRGVRLVMLVHDVYHFREWLARDCYDDELTLFKEYAAVLIVHNEAMRRKLAEEGVPENKMVVLSMFDYLTPGLSAAAPRQLDRRVIIAANLNPEKAKYLALLSSVKDVEWNLYGKYFDSEHVGGENIHYLGCLPPEQLPSKLEGGFGLVWDGDSLDSCAGKTGEYLLYNNPHKTSLYLTAGLPVIVWDKSAVAPFVAEHGVGFAVSAIKQIGERLSRVTTEEYDRMCANARKVSDDLRSGAYTWRAIEKALSAIRG